MKNQILRGRSHVNLEVSSLFSRVFSFSTLFRLWDTTSTVGTQIRSFTSRYGYGSQSFRETNEFELNVAKKKRREGIRGGTIAERSMTRRLRWRCSHLGASNLPSTYTYCLLESSILYISSDFNYYILFIVTRHLVLPRRVDSSLDRFQKLRKERKRFSANAMKHGWESSTLGSSRGGAKNVDNLDKSS